MSKQSKDSSSFFCKMVDEIVEFADYDSELAEGLRWADAQAWKKGISFYDMVYQVLYNHDVKEKAKEWLEKKGEENE